MADQPSPRWRAPLERGPAEPRSRVAPLDRPTRLDLLGAGIAAAWLTAFAVGIALTPGGRGSDPVNEAIYLVPAAAALGLLVLATGGRDLHARLIFGSFSTFLLLTLAGYAVADLSNVSGSRLESTPSLSDVLYVAAYVALLPGVATGWRPLGRLRVSVAGLDAAVVVGSLAFAGYALLLEPLLRDPSLAGLTATAYPVFDLVAVMVFVPVVLGFRSAPPGASFLLGSFVVASAADTAYAYCVLQGRSVFDTWWVLCYQGQFLLLALGGLWGMQRPLLRWHAHTRGRDVCLPLALVGVGAAGTILAVRTLADRASLLEVAFAGALFALLLARMLLADRDLRRAERAARARGEDLELVVVERTLQLAASEAEVRRSREASIRRLAEAIGLRDHETGDHIERISLYSSLLAERLELDAETVELLRVTSPLHDIGKIGIPDAILLKPGPLSPEERAEMEKHALIGHNLLAGSGQPLLDFAAQLALTHHERWDGTGYPNRLAGEHIPVAGRILAVCDVFDALTSDRVYRPALPLDDALDILRQGRASQFDPTVLDAFFTALPDLLALRERTGKREVYDAA